MVNRLWAVVPAAGLGLRAGGREPKQFAVLRGKTMLEWTVGRVLSMTCVFGVVVALPTGFESMVPVKRMMNSLGQDKMKNVFLVKGGQTRQESVCAALEKIPPEVSWVMVHDGSRPFLSEDLTMRVFEAAVKCSAAICGISVTDTLKKTTPFHPEGYGFAIGTLPREGVVAVQTPQIFKLDLLRRCHEIANKDGFIGTDDSQLLERLGHKVCIVRGERTNIKITFPEDLQEARGMLDEKIAGRAESPGVAVARLGAGTWDYGISGAKKPRRLRRLNKGVLSVTGLGFDMHPLSEGRMLVLGGVEIPFSKGLSGHSDADVLCHAVADALLGALNMGDIGKWFPPEEPKFLNANSLDLLAEIWSAVGPTSRIIHLDCTLVAQEPRLTPYMEKMRRKVSETLSISANQVSIKATSPERLGSLGSGEGIAALCAATLMKKGRF